VLLIVVDALRADHLGAYGYARPTSPTLDDVAKHATLFTRAHSTTSWTNPAVESLFTGDHPRILQPGAAQFILPNARTLAAAFREGGYRTGAIIANPVLPPELGLPQGFDSYLPVSGWVHGVGRRRRSRELVNDAAARWWRDAPSPARPCSSTCITWIRTGVHAARRHPCRAFGNRPMRTSPAAMQAINERVGPAPGRTDTVGGAQVTDSTMRQCACRCATAASCLPRWKRRASWRIR